MPTTSRRNIVRGAAWSVPAVATAAAAPALAASPSQCKPSLSWRGDATYNFGTLDAGTTNQSLALGGQTYVNNLPPGVNVTSVSYQFWIQNRVGQTTTGPGAYWMGNSASDQKGTCTANSCSASWAPTAGSGFSTTVTNTANLSAQIYPDGITRQAWDLNMTWSASKAPGTYTQTSSGCQNFTTGPSDKFRISYTDVKAMTSADKAAGKEVVYYFVIVTAQLDNGQTLTTRLQGQGATGG